MIFVVGFYDPVHSELERTHKQHLELGEIVWVPQVRRGGGADLVRLASLLFQKLAEGQDKVHVILGRRSGEEWMDASMEAMATQVRERFPNAALSYSLTKRLGESRLVIDEIAMFGLSAINAIGLNRLTERLSGNKVLCVRLRGRSNFQDALRRAGFCEESWEEVFVQETIDPGRHSSMMGDFEGWSNSYKFLLYAWDGLRTLKPEVKKRFSGKAYEAPTPTRVIEPFKRWILEGD
jgi:hypothetical protein